MKSIFRQTQLYTFLLYCEGTDLKRKILDCGAGGKLPPLAMFHDHGYETYGIELSPESIDEASVYEKTHGIHLNIQQGDMRSLPHGDGTISFAYSYNSIFHMKKAEIKEAIREIHRVLTPGGLAFVNFASDQDGRYGEGKKIAPGEYLQSEYGETVLHSYFSPDEADPFFQDFRILYKENRIREGFNMKNEKIRMGYIDYILEKPMG